MPLHDHFRPPLSLRRHWHSFHHAWCTYLAAHLNRQLPPGYFAESNVSAASALYAVAYRLASRAGQPHLDIWQNDLELGQPLPVLPLCLRGGLCIPGDLESTYQRTCDEQRILDGS